MVDINQQCKNHDISQSEDESITMMHAESKAFNNTNTILSSILVDHGDQKGTATKVNNNEFSDDSVT